MVVGVVRAVMQAGFLGLLLVSAALLIGGSAIGSIVAVQSNSMQPSFSAGDALLLRRTSPNNLKVGDIITYQNPVDSRTTVSHRIVAIHTKGFVTQGDAQRIPGVLVPKRTIKGKAVVLLPRIGRILTWLRSPLGLVLACYIPALSVVGIELWQLSRRLHRPVYRLNPYP